MFIAIFRCFRFLLSVLAVVFYSLPQTGHATSTFSFHRTHVLGEGQLLDAVFSPTGMHLAVATAKTVQLFDTNRELKVSFPQKAPVISMLMFTDDRLLGFSRNELVEWDLEGKFISSIPLEVTDWKEESYFRIEVGGSVITFFGPNNRIQLISRSTGKVISTPKLFPLHEDGLPSLAISPRGTLLAGSTGQGSVRVFDLSGRQLRVIEAEGLDSFDIYNYPPSMYFINDGKQLLVMTPTVWYIFDPLTGSVVDSYKKNTKESFLSIFAFMTANSSEFQVIRDRKVETWSLYPLKRLRQDSLPSLITNQNTVRKLQPGQLGGALVYLDEGMSWLDLKTEKLTALGPFRSDINGLAYRPDGQLFVVSTNTLEGWDAQSLTPLSSFPREYNSLTGVSFNQNNYHFLGHGHDYFIVMNSETGETINWVQTSGELKQILFGVDGKSIYAVLADETLQIINGKTFEVEKSISGVLGIALQPSGRNIAIYSQNKTANKVAVWNSNLTEEIFVITGRFLGVDYSPSGEFLLVKTADGVSVFSPENGTLLRKINFNSSKCVKTEQLAVSSLNVLAVTTSNNLCIYDIISGQLLQETTSVQKILNLTFNPAGDTLLVGSAMGILEVFKYKE